MLPEMSNHFAPHQEAVPPGGALHFMHLNKHQIRYFVSEEQAEQPPLLICNGLGQSIEILYPLIRELSGRIVIAFDIPGIGRSDYRSDLKTISQFSDCAVELMTHLGIQTYDVMGISWGGCLAQQIAHDHPEHVRRLILGIASAGGVGSWWGTPLALSEILFPLRYASKAYGNWIGPFMYGGDAIARPDEFKQYTKYAIPPTFEGYYAQVRAMCTWTSLPWLHQLEQPALIISGKYDALIPVANQLILANAIPSSELHVLPDGHLLMYSRRKQVGVLVKKFLS